MSFGFLVFRRLIPFLNGLDDGGAGGLFACLGSEQNCDHSGWAYKRGPNSHAKGLGSSPGIDLNGRIGKCATQFELLR